MPAHARFTSIWLSAAAALLLCAAAPAGPGPATRMHHASRKPAPSTLPPPHYAGDAATRLDRAYGGRKIDVATYHYDLDRTGWNRRETDLTPANVADQTQFGLLATLQVDGNVLAEPLLISNFKLPGHVVRDLLIVATGHDSVYAFDAQTYQVVWQVSLGTSQSSTDVGCFDVQPEYGISGTPVIVRTAENAGSIYLVAATEPSPGVFVSKLHRLNLATGHDIVPPVVISPSATLNDGSTVAFDPQNQWNRPGLAFANNKIYISVGSHCDNAGWMITGWLLSYDPAKLAALESFHTVQTHGGSELASIWMTGFAPAIDSAGNIFVATGNGDYTRDKMDWGESVLKLNPNMSTVLSSFTARNFNFLSNNDVDLGSGGVMLLPRVIGQKAPPMAVQMGKSGTLYLLNQNRLGGIKPNDSGALQSQNAGGGLWGGPAYYEGPNGPTVFTQGDSDVLKAWSVNTGSTPSLTKAMTGNSWGGYGGSLPIVSSNGSSNGIVWLINRAQEPFSVEAYDASVLGTPIFSAQVGTWSNASQGNPFLTPLEANGRVYVPGYLLVQVYGLLPQ
jgi:hypothetical protein